MLYRTPQTYSKLGRAALCMCVCAAKYACMCACLDACVYVCVCLPRYALMSVYSVIIYPGKYTWTIRSSHTCLGIQRGSSPRPDQITSTFPTLQTFKELQTVEGTPRAQTSSRHTQPVNLGPQRIRPETILTTNSRNSERCLS